MNSLKTILSLNPSMIYPGHGPEITDPSPKIEQYIKHREQREKQILDALVVESLNGKAMTPMEIVKIVYKVSFHYKSFRL